MTDASDMLAAALEQMDGIIAGNARGAARPALTVPCALSAPQTPRFSPLSCFSNSAG